MMAKCWNFSVAELVILFNETHYIVERTFSSLTNKCSLSNANGSKAPTSRQEYTVLYFQCPEFLWTPSPEAFTPQLIGQQGLATDDHVEAQWIPSAGWALDPRGQGE